MKSIVFSICLLLAVDYSRGYSVGQCVIRSNGNGDTGVIHSKPPLGFAYLFSLGKVVVKWENREHPSDVPVQFITPCDGGY